jgi:NAD-dependent oxidoreductase involved in siderophore biosynthesis
MSEMDEVRRRLMEVHASEAKMKVMVDATIQALQQICGTNAADWIVAIECVLANLLAGNLSPAGVQFNIEAFHAELRQRIQQVIDAKAKRSPIVVTSQIPPAPKKLPNWRL